MAMKRILGFCPPVNKRPSDYSWSVVSHLKVWTQVACSAVLSSVAWRNVSA